MAAKLSPQVARYMATRRRAWRDDGRLKDHFPQWCEGMTTARYVAIWERTRHLVPTVPLIK